MAATVSLNKNLTTPPFGKNLHNHSAQKLFNNYTQDNGRRQSANGVQTRLTARLCPLTSDL